MTSTAPKTRVSNTGHGHVWPRPDGLKARCGGHTLCRECRRDFALLHAPRCSTCVHWFRGNWSNLRGLGLDENPRCNSPKIAELARGEEDYQAQKDQDDMLVYSYYEGGTFFTGPNFGCVHHEERP